MKLCIVIGARPQFIKAAPVARAMACHDEDSLLLVHTGQHYDANMSEVFFSELEIPTPQYNLGVGSGSHGETTGRMLAGIEKVLLDERPDVMMVFGDTNSTIAAALAAAKLHIPVVHVEAGLRSFNRAMPEELNRILTDQCSDLLLVPTQTAIRNLMDEGFRNIALDGRLLEREDAERVSPATGLVANVGDVMFDAALFYGEKAERESTILQTLGLGERSFALATVHRAENTDSPERLAGVFAGLRAAARHCAVVLPLHPRTRAVLERTGRSDEYLAGLTVIDPVSYLDMVMLEKSSRLILTDSGGVQKEAFFHGVPCVTMRDETEWVELVAGGYNTIAGASAEAIEAAVEGALGVSFESRGGLYGTGKASEAIHAVVKRCFG